MPMPEIVSAGQRVEEGGGGPVGISASDTTPGCNRNVGVYGVRSYKPWVAFIWQAKRRVLIDLLFTR